MVVCQVNQEQELQDAQYVEMILEQSKTRMVDLMEKLDYRSTALKTAGLGVQLYILAVDTVAKKSRQLKVRINNTVIWSVVIMDISTRLAKMQVLGKVIKHRIQQYTNGFTRIIKSLMYVTTASVKDIPSGQTYHKNTTENEMTGLTCASRAILSLTEKITRTSDAINSVIRKRYAKFVSPDNTLPVS